MLLQLSFHDGKHQGGSDTLYFESFKFGTGNPIFIAWFVNENRNKTYKKRNIPQSQHVTNKWNDLSWEQMDALVMELT